MWTSGPMPNHFASSTALLAWPWSVYEASMISQFPFSGNGGYSTNWMEGKRAQVLGRYDPAVRGPKCPRLEVLRWARR